MVACGATDIDRVAPLADGLRAEVIGRALSSTVVTMAELGSIGDEVLQTHSLTHIDPQRWYPAQIRCDIHESVMRRFGDVALQTFGFAMADYYPEAMDRLRQQLPVYDAMLAAATDDAGRRDALAFMVSCFADNYHGNTRDSQRGAGVTYGFWARRTGDSSFEFEAVTTLGASHAAFASGIIEGYVSRFLERDWAFELAFQPERSHCSDLHSHFFWIGHFRWKEDRSASYAELSTRRMLQLKEALLRSVMLESNRALSQVMESIRYAGLLQQGQLPDVAAIGAKLRSFGVVWQQRDTIGGDLWWATADGNELSIALVDCAGHGVPGAMLSVLVIASLEKIYAAQPGIDPASALAALDSSVRKGLRQQDDASESRYNDDGCDAAILRIAGDRTRVAYSGAKVGLFQLTAAGEVIHHKPARVSLGYRELPQPLPELQHITLAPGDLLLMASDGLADQPGGERGVAFGYRRIAEVLARCQGMAAPQVVQAMQAALVAWQGERSRRDDLTILVLQA